MTVTGALAGSAALNRMLITVRSKPFDWEAVI
jgi:hypothetical protein